MVAGGSLGPGERLPSVREISASLQINPLTVAKAYQELEHAGVVTMRRGLGVFVAATAPQTAPATGGDGRGRVVELTAERLVLEAAQAGMGEAEVLRAVSEAWRRIHQIEPEVARDDNG